MTLRPARTRKCKACKAEFKPMSSTHVACSIACSVAYVRAKKAQAERKQDLQRRRALKTRSGYIKEAQVVFNAYIRARDAAKPCICCGKPLAADAVGGGFDCGHYRSVGSAPHLRFDPRNAHGQTKKCNRWGAGRAVDYRIGLIKRIGLAQVEELEADQSERHWSIPELILIRDRFKLMRRELMQVREIEVA